MDCYTAYHYGANTTEYGMDPRWDRDRFLNAIEAIGRDHIADNTDMENDDGYTTFSWSECDLCQSALGGSRYRMAVWVPVK
jgi:hypothetical protein